MPVTVTLCLPSRLAGMDPDEGNEGSEHRLRPRMRENAPACFQSSVRRAPHPVAGCESHSPTGQDGERLWAWPAVARAGSHPDPTTRSYRLAGPALGRMPSNFRRGIFLMAELSIHMWVRDERRYDRKLLSGCVGYHRTLPTAAVPTQRLVTGDSAMFTELIGPWAAGTQSALGWAGCLSRRDEDEDRVGQSN